MPIDEEYYKPIITNSAFNSNYIQYESMGGEGKDKNLSIKEYLDRTKPLLSNIINNYKTEGKWKIHSGNKIIERKAQVAWKIQLTMAIKFISSKPDSDETRIMHTRSYNVKL